MPRTRARRVGRVTSDRADKTIIVEVESIRRHAIYRKPVRVRRTLMAHDPHNTCRIGDQVEIEESRPLSRRKRWRLIDVVERAQLTAEEHAAASALATADADADGGADQRQAGEEA